MRLVTLDRRRRRHRKSASAQVIEKQDRGKAPLVLAGGLDEASYFGQRLHEGTAQDHVLIDNAFVVLTEESEARAGLGGDSMARVDGKADNELRVVSEELTMEGRRRWIPDEASNGRRVNMGPHKIIREEMCGTNIAEMSMPSVSVSDRESRESKENFSSRREQWPTLHFEDLVEFDQIDKGSNRTNGKESDGSIMGLETDDTTGLAKDIQQYHISPSRGTTSELGGVHIPSGRGQGSRGVGRGIARGKSLSVPTMSR